MEDNNYAYLSQQLSYLGYNENLNLGLLNQASTHASQFSVRHETSYGNDSARASFHFRKPEGSELYFFNTYTLEVKRNNDTEALKQTFYINKGQDNITLKEGYNLLQGRAIYKELSTREGEKYNAWVQLDFKNADENGNFIVNKFHQNYGFDLAAVLDKHPIKELMDVETKKRLMESLERGNRQSVTYIQGDTEKKLFIEAAPKFKSINIYDSGMKRLKSEQLSTTNEVIKSDQTTRKDQKKEMSASEENRNKQGKKNRVKGPKVG